MFNGHLSANDFYVLTQNESLFVIFDIYQYYTLSKATCKIKFDKYS